MVYRMCGKRALVRLSIPDGWEKDPGTGNFVQKTDSGLIKLGVEGSTFKKNKGVVEVIGSEVKTVKVGDKIVFEDYAPTFFDLDQNDLFWIEESAIVAVIED